MLKTGYDWVHSDSIEWETNAIFMAWAEEQSYKGNRKYVHWEKLIYLGGKQWMRKEEFKQEMVLSVASEACETL